MYKNCLCIKAQYYRNRNFKNSQCCKTIFHIHLVSYHCFIPQFHSSLKLQAALKASTMVNTSQFWDTLVIMVHNSLTRNNTHNMERQVLFFICSQKQSSSKFGAQLQLLLKTAFCRCFLAKMLYITKTFDSVIYSILCYFLHFRLEYSPQHLFATPYFPVGEKQICPHAGSKIRILWTSIFRLLFS